LSYLFPLVGQYTKEIFASQDKISKAKIVVQTSEKLRSGHIVQIHPFGMKSKFFTHPKNTANLMPTFLTNI